MSRAGMQRSSKLSNDLRALCRKVLPRYGIPLPHEVEPWRRQWMYSSKMMDFRRLFMLWKIWKWHQIVGALTWVVSQRDIAGTSRCGSLHLNRVNGETRRVRVIWVGSMRCIELVLGMLMKVCIRLFIYLSGCVCDWMFACLHVCIARMW